MSAAAAISRRRATFSPTVAGAAAGALGAALGIALASGGPDEAGPRAAPAQPRIGLTSGVARLQLPAGWRPLGRRSTLPGLEAATAVRAVHAEAALDIRPPEDPSLLPAGVRVARADGLPRPRIARVNGRTVWRYDLGELRPGAHVVAFALPTTGGVVTIACTAPGGALVSAAADCEEAMSGLRLVGVSALAPTPETAAAIVLPDTIGQLNRHRRNERRRLAATRRPQRRSAAAWRLARAYTVAAERVGLVAAGNARPLTGTLTALAEKHRTLATASLRRDAVAARMAGASIEQGEQRVGRLLARIRRAAHPTRAERDIAR